MSRPPDRRTALRWGAAAVLVLGAPAATAGCSREQGSPSPVDLQRQRDDAARARAIARSQALLATTQQLRGTTAAVTAQLRAGVTVHRAHLQALAGGTGGSPTVSAPSLGAPVVGSVSGSAASAPVAAPPTAATLLALTGATVAANLTEVAATSPALAQLLAQVSAAQAELADRLALAAALPVPAPTPGTVVAPPEAPDGVEPSGSAVTTSGSVTAPPSGSAPSDDTAATGRPSGTASPAGPVGRTQALVALVGAEQALDYVYGVLASRAGTGSAARVGKAWTEHRRRLAILTAQLQAAGSAVPPPPAGYDLGEPPAGEAAVLDLAATAENGCTAVVLALVARSEGGLRTQVAAEAVAQARRAGQWQPDPQPFPGTAA